MQGPYVLNNKFLVWSVRLLLSSLEVCVGYSKAVPGAKMFPVLLLSFLIYVYLNC